MEVYEEKWKVDAADDDSRRFAEMAELYCLICRELVWDPVVCECCGKLFCGSCASQWSEVRKSYECPSCRSKTLPVSITSNSKQIALKNVIGKMRLLCPSFATAGCSWRGDYSDAKVHVQSKCPFASCSCDYCHAKMSRRSLVIHKTICDQRPLPCPDCKTGSFSPGAPLDQHKKDSCLAAIAMCSGCVWKGPKAQLEAHLNTCGEVMITCNIPTCGKTIKRKEMKEHKTDFIDKHIDMLLAKITQLEQKKPSRKRKKEHTGVNAPDKKVKVEEKKNDGDDEPGRWIDCTTLPKCPFDGSFDRMNPFGQRCVNCNRQRSSNKVPCSTGLSPACWGSVYPHPQFGTVCKPCRDFADLDFLTSI